MTTTRAEMTIALDLWARDLGAHEVSGCEPHRPGGKRPMLLHQCQLDRAGLMRFGKNASESMNRPISGVP